MKRKAFTERGFRIYHEDPDLFVVESSVAFEGAHVRIYDRRGGDCSAHLSVAQAESVEKALRVFIAEARAGELTEAPENGGGK